MVSRQQSLDLSVMLGFSNSAGLFLVLWYDFLIYLSDPFLMCVYAYACMEPWRPERCVRSFGTEVIGSCKLFSVGDEREAVCLV